jgi:hypothetical protein
MAGMGSLVFERTRLSKWARVGCQMGAVANGCGCRRWWVFEQVQLGFQRAVVVETGMIGFQRGCGYRNGGGWVFEQAQLSNRRQWVVLYSKGLLTPIFFLNP